VKIGCHCGATIIDQTDDLPHKAHLVPDQAWFATYDAFDDELIDPLVNGTLTREAAYRLTRAILSRATRLMWQCGACGRLYIDDRAGNLQCYLPSEDSTAKEILRSRDTPA
jgi:hypothetical protein